MKNLKTIITTLVGLLFAVGTQAADIPALMQPVKSVYDHYLKIQTSLAKDSLKGVHEEADVIAKAVEADSMKMLPTEVASEAGKLGAAKDLKDARVAFKSLSESLIKYLADHKARGAYVEVYCPMAKAGWLQADKNVKNPYMGNAMSSCGVIKD